jgi:hypothetical protein
MTSPNFCLASLEVKVFMLFRPFRPKWMKFPVLQAKDFQSLLAVARIHRASCPDSDLMGCGVAVE